MPRRAFLSLLIIAALTYTVIYSLNACRQKQESSTAMVDTVAVLDGGFVGDGSCGTCHRKEYEEWRTSDHAHAMLEPTDSTVLGDFNNTTYSANGITSRFFTRDGKFLISTQGPSGSNEEFEVRYTFGIRPLQQYLVSFPKGKMQSTRQCWDTAGEKWFHQYPGDKIYHRDWLHWTGQAQNWNSMCASCHSTNLRMNYNAAADSFNTTWTLINVSCEACHGPGKRHVEYVSSRDYDSTKPVPGSYLVFASKQSSKDQLTTCAPCHSRRMTIDESPFQSLELLNHYIPETPHTPLYHPDGQFNEEVYEYGSFTQTRMFMHNVKCSDCHNTHSGKLVTTGNALCLQCHEKKLDSPQHHFHPVTSAGAQCINCHMTTKTYMVTDERRDHSFRVPRPDQSVKYGTPNACTQCHAGKSARWAADLVVKWYGPDRRYHFSDDLIPGSLGTAESARHLQKLCSPDTNIPSVAHAAALRYMSFTYDQGNISFIVDGMKHDDPQVRYEALRTARFYPISEWVNEAQALLQDPVKAVRIAAADLFLEYPDSVASSFLGALHAARSEWSGFLLLQAPFPAGRMMMGDAQSRLKNYTEAERDYLKAIEFDSLLLPARINLSTMYDIIGQKEKALQQLLTAYAIEPQNEQVLYYLALIYVEMNEMQKALDAFSKASMVSKNPRLFYNYGLLLEQMKRDGQAEIIYKKGLSIDPENRDLNYVMALYYYRRARSPEAMPYVLKLLQQSPQDPNYRQLYETLSPR
jgi:hypothetical protein